MQYTYLEEHRRRLKGEGGGLGKESLQAAMQASHSPEERGHERGLDRKKAQLQESYGRQLGSPRAEESPLGGPGWALGLLLCSGRARPQWDPQGTMAGGC